MRCARARQRQREKPLTQNRTLALVRRLAAFSLLAVVAVASHGNDRFTVSADGTEVADSTTNLVWRRCAEGLSGPTCSGKLSRFKYGAAKADAERLAKNDAKAWRIPSKDELVSLLDKTVKKKPLINIQAFPKTPSDLFWATRAGTDDNLNAGLVSFANGRVSGNTGEKAFPLRLVRAGP
jgi:hypothetical protein